jgi:hypothetical protein
VACEAEEQKVGEAGSDLEKGGNPFAKDKGELARTGMAIREVRESRRAGDVPVEGKGKRR